MTLEWQGKREGKGGCNGPSGTCPVPSQARVGRGGGSFLDSTVGRKRRQLGMKHRA